MTALDERIRGGLAAQLRALRARTAQGERRVGWKIALNDSRVQRALDIRQPVIGYLASGSEVATGGTHPLTGTTNAAVEPEIAVHLGPDGAIAGLGPALEVIDVNMPFDDLERVLAGNVFHHAVVFGPVQASRTGVEALTARFRHGGDQQSIDVAAAAMDPAAVVALVSGYLQQMGESLEEGDAIIGGSLVPAVPAREGGRFELDVDELGAVAVELAPAIQG